MPVSDEPTAIAPSIDQQYGPVQQFELESKRVLTYRVFGVSLSKGLTQVVLYHHGVPSCHLEGAVFAEAAAERNVAIVAVDRPGIGGSTYTRHLSLPSFAADCCELLSSLHVGRVVVVGNSGGGPYAVGFAACFPARTLALGLIAPLAPTDGSSRGHRENLKSMGGFDRFQLSAIHGATSFCALGSLALWLAHKIMRYLAVNKPELLLEYAPQGMAPVDGALMREDPRIRDNFAAVLQHAYSGTGARGVWRDLQVLAGPWGIDPGSVTCRTLIWHGTEDKSVPVQHSHFYASEIKDHQLWVLEGEGHITLPVQHSALIMDALLEAAQAQEEGGSGGAAPPPPPAAAAGGNDAGRTG